jgi:hypothetical protein
MIQTSLSLSPRRKDRHADELNRADIDPADWLTKRTGLSLPLAIA